jgi:hypothetical protein
MGAVRICRRRGNSEALTQYIDDRLDQLGTVCISQVPMGAANLGAEKI